MDLLALVVSIIALAVSLMTLPTVFQMFYGRPALRMYFEKHTIGNSEILRFHVKNDLVRSRVLRKIGVTRSAAEIEATVEVFKTGTNELVMRCFKPVLVTQKERGTIVSLPCQVMPAFINIAAHDDTQAYIIDGDNDNTPVVPGSYYAKVTVIDASSAQISAKTGEFVIGHSKDESYWLTN